MRFPVRSDLAAHVFEHSIIQYCEPTSCRMQAIRSIAHQDVTQRGQICNLVERVASLMKIGICCASSAGTAHRSAFSTLVDRSLVLGRAGSDTDLRSPAAVDSAWRKPPAPLLGARKPDAVLGLGRILSDQSWWSGRIPRNAAIWIGRRAVIITVKK